MSDLYTLGEMMGLFLATDTDDVATAKKFELFVAGAEANVSEAEEALLDAMATPCALSEAASSQTNRVGAAGAAFSGIPRDVEALQILPTVQNFEKSLHAKILPL
jgi:hypothetical protein